MYTTILYFSTIFRPQAQLRCTKLNHLPILSNKQPWYRPSSCYHVVVVLSQCGFRHDYTQSCGAHCAVPARCDMRLVTYCSMLVTLTWPRRAETFTMETSYMLWPDRDSTDSTSCIVVGIFVSATDENFLMRQWQHRCILYDIILPYTPIGNC